MLVRAAGIAATLAALAAAVILPAHAQFETRSNFHLSSSYGPESLVVGNFSHNGLLDVAVVTFTDSVQILIGNGDGTFRLGASYGLPGTVSYAATASLRHNGVLDLVLGADDADDVYVLLGNGDGSFQTPVAYPTTAKPFFLVELGDFLGNGKIDIITAEEFNAQGTYFCGCVEVLPGNGDGTFGAPITTPIPYGITGYSIGVGNFNDDGKLDMAVSGGTATTNQVDILLGDGNGSFTADGYVSLGGPVGNIATGPFTGDAKKIGLAVTNEVALGVMLGNGDGTFQPPVYYSTSFPSWVIAQDLDGDGKVDLAASNVGLTGLPPGVTVFKGNGDGTFQTGVFYPAGTNGDGGYFVAVGDFNRDGKPDLLVVDMAYSNITTLLNTGVVSLSPTTPLTFQNQPVGTTSSPLTVTLTNTGTIALKIASMKASAQFGVTSTCGTSVAPTAKCTISVTFSPTKKGAAQGAVTIIDSASSKPQVIELFGTGT